jgi:hypothetical protein
MFIVFFAVKIETPRDANTHDGHVKSRGITTARASMSLRTAQAASIRFTAA